MWGAEAAGHCSVGDVDGEARWDFWHPVQILILLATISAIHQRERITFLLTALVDLRAGEAGLTSLARNTSALAGVGPRGRHQRANAC